MEAEAGWTDDGWMDGWMEGWRGESVSPWQPTSNDPTPRKGWSDERMDGDNGGGVWVRVRKRRKGHGTKRNTQNRRRRRHSFG